ncbi:MAG TPA: hypothetical protein V6C71_01685 [Coleofasciculaceae cyanobacterium]
MVFCSKSFLKTISSYPTNGSYQTLKRAYLRPGSLLFALSLGLSATLSACIPMEMVVI